MYWQSLDWAFSRERIRPEWTMAGWTQYSTVNVKCALVWRQPHCLLLSQKQGLFIDLSLIVVRNVISYLSKGNWAHFPPTVRHRCEVRITKLPEYRVERTLRCSSLLVEVSKKIKPDSNLIKWEWQYPMWRAYRILQDTLVSQITKITYSPFDWHLESSWVQFGFPSRDEPNRISCTYEPLPKNHSTLANISVILRTSGLLSEILHSTGWFFSNWSGEKHCSIWGIQGDSFIAKKMFFFFSFHQKV